MYDSDDDGCGGCLVVLIIAGICGWIAEHWIPIVIVIGIIIAIPLIVLAVRKYKEHQAEAEAEAKRRAEQEAAEQAAGERETYDRYFAVQKDAHLNGKLDAANAIIRKLFAETNEDKRRKILDFLDKYLPYITEIIEASKHGGTDTDDAFRQFTETVKAFSRNLYKADEVIDVNKTMLESMAIRDGLYDPYEEAFGLSVDPDEEAEAPVIEEPEYTTVPDSTDDIPVEAETSETPVTIETPHATASHKTPLTESDVEMAMQDRLEEAILMDDFDTIRDMLDSGVISEIDVDDEVLEKVEEYV